MLKEKTAAEPGSPAASSSDSTLLGEMFRVGLYKRSQGKITRRITLAALVGAAAAGSYNLFAYLDGYFLTQGHGDNSTSLAIGVATGVFLLVSWICFRLVHYPRFADFLIAVDAEMNKMSWPSRGVLVRSSVVVIICLFVLAASMYLLDMFWVGVFQATGVLRF